MDRLLDLLPDRFALAGLSLGGIVAMALVRTAPERVSRLWLMSTNPYGPTERQLRRLAPQRDRLAGGTDRARAPARPAALLSTAESLRAARTWWSSP